MEHGGARGVDAHRGTVSPGADAPHGARPGGGPASRLQDTQGPVRPAPPQVAAADAGYRSRRRASAHDHTTRPVPHPARPAVRRVAHAHHRAPPRGPARGRARRARLPPDRVGGAADLRRAPPVPRAHRPASHSGRDRRDRRGAAGAVGARGGPGGRLRAVRRGAHRRHRAVDLALPGARVRGAGIRVIDAIRADGECWFALLGGPGTAGARARGALRRHDPPDQRPGGLRGARGARLAQRRRRHAAPGPGGRRAPRGRRARRPRRRPRGRRRRGRDRGP